MAPLILGVGFHWNHPMIATSGFTPERIQTAITSSFASLASAGYPIEGFFIETTDLDTTLEEWKRKLQEKKWETVMFGWGVRGTPKETVTFEALINAAREYAPQAKFAFNMSPDTTLDALKRVVVL